MKWIRIQNTVVDFSRVRYFEMASMEKFCLIAIKLEDDVHLSFTYKSKAETEKAFDEIREALCES